MDPLQQVDVASPDHVTVITKEDRITISILKDGITVMLSFPLKSSIPSSPPPEPQVEYFREYQGEEWFKL